MPIRYKIKKDAYYDSVTLMLITNQVKKAAGVRQAVIGMATDYNIDSLKRLNLFQPEFEKLSTSDLILCVEGPADTATEQALVEAERLLSAKRKGPSGPGAVVAPATQEAAVRQLPQANMVLISVPGAHAAREAELALEAGRHVMLFSDNVTIDEERTLKDLGVAKQLLVMGPDCGTAIINGVPLAFANAVRRGPVGLVGASGTGLQEVTSLIHTLGSGITQAIGVGGRDLSERIGGRMTMLAARALADDPTTKVIVLISKPPAESTLKELFLMLKSVKKPIVIYFIGADTKAIRDQGFVAAESLEDAALKAVSVTEGKMPPPLLDEVAIRAKVGKLKLTGSYLRGLYSGGTLCDEAQRQLLPVLGEMSSNTPVKGVNKLADIFKSTGHTIVDLGDDDFTRGRAHPMIDPALRQERIAAEFGDPSVGLLLLDVVLGYGSHPDMATALAEALLTARRQSSREVPVLATMCGTEDDPQGYMKQRRTLEEAGVTVFPSHVSMMKGVKALFAKKG